MEFMKTCMYLHTRLRPGGISYGRDVAACKTSCRPGWNWLKGISQLLYKQFLLEFL